MKKAIVYFFAALSLTATLGVPASANDSTSAETEQIAPGSYLGDQTGLGDLKSFLVQASENNSALRSAFYKWQAAVKKAVQADTLPDPRFTFGYYTTPLETRGGPARYKYGLSQTLPFWGKLSSKQKIALREADGFKANFDLLKLKTFQEVKTVYYEYAYLARAIDITKENIELMNYLETIATTRYTTGTAKHSDVIRPQVEQGKLEDRLNSLQDLKRPLAARLNALLDRSSTTDIPFPASIPVMVIMDSNDSLVAQLDQSNPQLIYWETVMAKEEAGKDLAEQKYYPDLTFGLDVTEVDDARNPGVIGDGQNPVMATMSFNVPIWFNSLDAGVEESRARISAAKRSRIGAERKLKADLELALYKYRDAGRKIDLYKDTLIPKAEQSLGVIMEAFMTGSGSSLDLVDAEQTLLELQLAYYRSLTDQAQRLAEIETLVGTELPCEYHGSLLKKGRD